MSKTCAASCCQLLIVPQGQHFAVDRVHLTQRLIQPRRDFRSSGGRRRSGAPARQSLDQRGSRVIIDLAPAGRHPEVHFAPGITHLCAKMMTVQFQQCVPDDPCSHRNSGCAD